MRGTLGMIFGWLLAVQILSAGPPRLAAGRVGALQRRLLPAAVHPRRRCRRHRRRFEHRQCSRRHALPPRPGPRHGLSTRKVRKLFKKTRNVSICWPPMLT